MTQFEAVSEGILVGWIEMVHNELAEIRAEVRAGHAELLGQVQALNTALQAVLQRLAAQGRLSAAPRPTANVGSLVQFLEGGEVVRGPDQYMPFDEFRSRFYAWCHSTAMLAKPKSTPALWQAAFQQAGVVEEHSSKMWRGQQRQDKWLLGVGIGAEDDQDLLW